MILIICAVFSIPDGLWLFKILSSCFTLDIEGFKHIQCDTSVSRLDYFAKMTT